MDQDLITDSTPDSGYVQPKFGDTVDRCTAFVRGETMGGVFCDSELVLPSSAMLTMAPFP